MFSVLRPGCQLVVDQDLAIAERIPSGPLPCGGDRIGDHKRSIEAHDLQIVAESEIGNMNPIGDESDPQLVGTREHPLDHIVVSRQELRTTITEVREGRESGIDASG